VTRVSRGLDRVEVDFDDPSLVANAGLILAATLYQRLGLAKLIDDTVHLDGRVGGAMPGRKVLTLVDMLIAGGSHIDHANMLRAGATGQILGHRVMAPSTLGTFLRAFSFGHVRQLEAVIGVTLARAWANGAGPGADRIVVDIDSTIAEVAGKQKSGAGYGYTHVLGYHPLIAVRAGTGEILAARMRKGSANTSRGIRRFCEELVPRLRRAGATGPIVVRFDSGFWSNDTVKTLQRLKVGFTIGIRTGVPKVAKAIGEIADNAWVDIDYTPDGAAQVAETVYGGRRLIVRRTRLTDKAQAKLWPDWRHHAFWTDQHGTAAELDRFHRAHATVELAIKDLKEGAGLEHVPSGNFSANSAWLCCAVLAYNLIRWTATTGTAPADQLIVARTVRTRLIAMPARLVNRSGTPTLRAPQHWPWATQFTDRLDAIRALPATG
jgi:hypothetical protein